LAKSKTAVSSSRTGALAKRERYLPPCSRRG
jgi:hypothetical protein